MSEDYNRIEDLEREEDRSEESSTMSSQLRDFMSPDNTYSGGVDDREVRRTGGAEDQVELQDPLTEETLASAPRVTEPHMRAFSSSQYLAFPHLIITHYKHLIITTCIIK